MPNKRASRRLAPDVLTKFQTCKTCAAPTPYIAGRLGPTMTRTLCVVHSFKGCSFTQCSKQGWHMKRPSIQGIWLLLHVILRAPIRNSGRFQPFQPSKGLVPTRIGWGRQILFRHLGQFPKDHHRLLPFIRTHLPRILLSKQKRAVPLALRRRHLKNDGHACLALRARLAAFFAERTETDSSRMSAQSLSLFDLERSLRLQMGWRCFRSRRFLR